jgi:hypothetical protein
MEISDNTTKMARLKGAFIVILSGFIMTSVHAQDEKDKESRGFKKENLFTGGSIALGLSNNSFQIGASPVLGYSIASWVDAGISVNYNYVSFKDVYAYNDKIRRSTYGGGAFARIYPVNFLFAHVQFEHNFITEKFMPGNGDASSKNKVEANSLLLGLGYSSERYPHSGRPFFYISLLFDVLNNDFSPYSSATGNIRPFIRAGIQVPIFQGGK